MELKFSVKEKSFGKTDRVTRVLSGVSFTVPAQSIVCLYGPSGCGKSTMLRIAAGLDTDYRGHIYLGEDSITHPTRDIGFVVQTAVSYDWLTVADNIAFGLKYAERQRQTSSFNRLMGRVDSAYAMAEAKRIASVVGLSLADLAKRPSEISVGMKQRMAFARALLTNPQVLLLDEPFSSLDFESRQSLQDVVLRVREELGTSFLCVSHDPEEVLYLADEVIVLGGAPAAIVYRMKPVLPDHGSEEARYTQEFQQAKKDLQQWLIPTTQQMPRKATDLRSVSLP